MAHRFLRIQGLLETVLPGNAYATSVTSNTVAPYGRVWWVYHIHFTGLAGQSQSVQGQTGVHPMTGLAYEAIPVADFPCLINWVAVDCWAQGNDAGDVRGLSSLRDPGPDGTLPFPHPLPVLSGEALEFHCHIRNDTTASQIYQPEVGIWYSDEADSTLQNLLLDTFPVPGPRPT